MEKDEDTFDALKAVAESITLTSRNDNDEVIGVEYYNHLELLTPAELAELITLWQKRKLLCHKERWASQLMVIQVFILISLAMFIAWLSGGIAGALVSIVGIVGIIAMIEDKRVTIAKRNFRDAEQIYFRLQQQQSKQQAGTAND